MTLFVTLSLSLQGQTSFFFSDNTNSAAKFLTIDDDQNITCGVVEFTADSLYSSHLCSLINGELSAQYTVEGEDLDYYFYHSDTHWLISGTDDQIILRSINSFYEILNEFILSIPAVIRVHEATIIGENLILVYNHFGSLRVAKISLTDGSVLEQVLLQGTTWPYQSHFSFRKAISDTEILVGISCDRTLRINPQNLVVTNFEPLPYSEEEATFYNPCFGLSDILRPSAQESIDFIAMSTDGSSFISFYFDSGGNIPFFHDHLFEEVTNVSDHTDNSLGERWILLLNSQLENEDSNLQLAKTNPDGDLIWIETRMTPEWQEHGYQMTKFNDDLILFGSKSSIVDSTFRRAEVILANEDGFPVNLNEYNTKAKLTFINSNDWVGSSEPGIDSIQIIDIYGRRVEKSIGPKLWRKTDLQKGMLIFRIETKDSQKSWLVRN